VSCAPALRYVLGVLRRIEAPEPLPTARDRPRFRSAASYGGPVPTSVTLIRSTTLSDAQYAYAATAPAAARLIFLAGACPLDADGATVAVGDYAGQARQSVENLRIALADVGAGLTDVISTRVLVASSHQSDLGTAWEVVRDAFGEHDVPSTLVGVTVLGYRDQLVEIEAVAAVVDAGSAQ
jgi:enamine deaminase RidA (YjgF/YER057c/UK114 family)